MIYTVHATQNITVNGKIHMLLHFHVWPTITMLLFVTGILSLPSSTPY